MYNEGFCMRTCVCVKEYGYVRIKAFSKLI